MNRRFDAYRLLCSSELAKKIYRNSHATRKRLNEEQRKVWPVARLARLFGVSNRLLWVWIKAGLLRTQKPPPGSPKKKGIAKSDAVRFLNRLKETADQFDLDDHFPSLSVGRPDRAMQKIRQVRWRLANGLTPGGVAVLLGVSRTSVLRAIHENLLDAWQPTPCRYRIGRKPRLEKKRK